MDNYTLIPSPKTPRINFKEGGSLEISGRSIPENSVDFYQPVLDWVEAYTRQPAAETNLVVKLEYFNTSTSKCLIEMFRKLETIADQSAVKIQWHYEEEDEDMMESGKDFQHILKIPLELIESEL
jgi:hypothetical protein